MADSAFDSLLNHTCTVYRRSNSGTADEWGAVPETINSSSTLVPCNFQQMEEDIEITKRGKKIRTRICVFFKITANVLEDDILEFNGKRYEVLSVDDAAGIGHHLEVFVSNMEN